MRFCVIPNTYIRNTELMLTYLQKPPVDGGQIGVRAAEASVLQFLYGKIICYNKYYNNMLSLHPRRSEEIMRALD